MSHNPARLLINFFGASLSDKDGHSFTALWTALNDIEEHFPIWRAQGHPVDTFADLLPVWKRGVLAHVDGNTGEINSAANRFTPQPGDIGVLTWVASLLDQSVPGSTATQRDGIREMVAEVRGGLRDDDSLPEMLRLHIARLLLHVEEVLDNFEIMGDAALEEAVERLIGVLRQAESASSKPDLWSAFWDKWGIPVSVGITSGAPQTALAITQLLGGS
ncbi:hypothetical protein DEU35_3270 [Microbacterium sp. AG157]|uniref:hypothetical protein n=1 Tax=Microbacterium sp. AG157 TaxID=2183993 RepID=UPI000E38DE01|nr:hypothetical protein [Microbacterium sp. AG157]REC96790.1 hypothetical protein DEU35_3270 [Microbacterium sp. AG157]